MPTTRKHQQHLRLLVVNLTKTRCSRTHPKRQIHSKSFDEHLTDTTSSEHSPEGYFLQQDLTQFDAECFSLNRTEAAQLDPVQRQLLEITQECLDSAGATETAGQKFGCFVGTFGEDWQDLRRKDTLDHGPYHLIGAADFAASNRISFEYDFRGPSVTYRTAWSVSLVALHSACQALQLHDCDSALVVTANLILSPTNTSGLADLGALASDGSSKTFDVSASGYARAEAVSALFVKRLDDALVNGDPIRAVIRATASNSDGRSSAFSNPSPAAHVELMRTAYAVSGLSPHDTAFVEMHGTGTAVRDPIEAEAVAEVFGSTEDSSSTYIGSVKPNVGHSKGASGLTSVIKAVLALEHEVLPPNIKFNQPNPRIPFAEAGLIVPVELTSWPAGKAKRVSVNSFGLGGSNAHAIIEAFRKPRHTPQTVNSVTKDANLVVFSAFRQESVRQMIDQTARYISSHPNSDRSVSFTLNNRRHHRRKRAFGICRDGCFTYTHPPAEILTSSRVVYVFTGQGAQSLGMGAELAERYPSFDSDLMSMDRILQMTSSPPEWSLRDMIRDKCGHLDKIPGVISQPLCIALQIALVNLLRDWGVSPDAVVGHSSGEIVAAYASGAISMEEAIITAFWRGQSLTSSQSSGSMAAVELSQEDVQSYLSSGVGVGCVNSPSNVTLSGNRDELDIAVAKIKHDRPTTFARTLGLDHAYHSEHMKEIANTYLSLMGSSNAPHKRQIPFYSTVYGRALKPNEDIDTAYWLKNIVQPVLFASAIASILEDRRRPTVFVEIGPHSALRGPLRQCIQKAARVDTSFYVPTLIRHEDSQECLLKTAGSLFSLGVKVDLAALTPTADVLHDLPSYPWQREKLWVEGRVSRQWRMRPHPRHELLGVPILENNELEPTWRNMLRVGDVPWLADHQIGSNTVFPGAGYIAMVGEAARQLGDVDGTEAYTVKNVAINNALVFHESQPVEILTSLKPFSWSKNQPSCWYDFTISSFQNDRWTQHCTGRVRSGFSEQNENIRPERHPRHVDPSRVYRKFARCGLRYGPYFARLHDITTSVQEQRGAASISVIPSGGDSQRSSYAVHPTDIDAMFQALMIANIKGHPRLLNGIYVPTTIGEMTVRRNGETPSKLRVNTKNHGSREHDMQQQHLRGSFIASAESVDSQTGTPLPTLEAHGVELSLVDKFEETTAFETDNSAAELVYQPSLRFMSGTQRAALFQPEVDISILQDDLEQLMRHLSHQRAELLQQAQPKTAYLGKYRDWLLKTVGSTSAPPVKSRYSHVSNMQQLLEGQEDDLASSAASAVTRIGENLIGIIEGRTTSLEILLQDDMLTKYYQLAQRFDYKDFISALIHENPTCRVLEIGAGTGGTTAKILPHLQPGSSTVPTYAEYCFTDVSEGFLTAAKEHFAGDACAAILTYQTFDITRDPAEQGMNLGHYDLVIATNVVHATPSLQQSLYNIRKVLAPGGTLLLQELCSQKDFTSFIMGGFQGWWLGSSDDRVTRPYLAPERWDTELKAAGFAQGADTVALDHPKEDYRFCAIIASRLEEQAAIVEPNGTLGPKPLRITLVTSPDSGDHDTLRIRDALNSDGFVVEVSIIGSSSPSASSGVVILLLDVLTPSATSLWSTNTDQRVGDGFATRKALIDCLQPHQRLIWLIPASASANWVPQHNMVYGLARTLRLERSLDFSILEIETDLVALEESLPAFVHEYRRFGGYLDGVARPDTASSIERAVSPKPVDFDYRLTARGVEVGRYQWYSVPQALLSSSQQSGHNRKTAARLCIAQPGVLSSLRWEVMQTTPELAAGHIRVQVQAVGMNFRDVLTAMGVVSSPGLGIEAVGIVAQVGDNITDLKVGDHVAILTEGAFATELTVSRLSVFCTNMLALDYVARIERGMTVLIHSACGGIGLSAIQLCQLAGVEVFATVGSAQKSEYLQRKFGLKVDRIFNSRDTSFKRNLLQATGGRGVNVVLNSLSGELLDASWDCVADFGMMLELGKRDIQAGGMLRMANFASNRAYHGIDLAHVIADRPEFLMRDVSALLDAGSIEAVAPVKIFGAQDIEQCFRYLQKGEHMGKVVVTIEPDFAAESRSRLAAGPGISFNPDAAYLLVGGLGGLGQAVSIWMAERGARHLVYISRSGRATKTEAFFEELAALGCTADVHKGSVVDPTLVSHTIRASRKPILGVLQMAMQLQNGTHGWHGQSNYATANTFLYGFANYRRAQGLAASVLDLGPVEDIGFVSERRDVQTKMGSIFRFLPESEFLRALELAIINSARPEDDSEGRSACMAQVIPGLHPRSPSHGSSISKVASPWAGDARFMAYLSLERAEQRQQNASAPESSSVVQNQASSGPSSSSGAKAAALTAFLSARRTEEETASVVNDKRAFEIVASAILGRLCMTTGMDPAPFFGASHNDAGKNSIEHIKIQDVGMDSLIAIEFQGWWRQVFRSRISVLEIMDLGTIGHLATRAVKLIASVGGSE